MIAKRFAQVNMLVIVAMTVTALVINLIEDNHLGFSLWSFSAIIYGLTAVLILYRHPGHIIGWLYLFIGFLFSLANMETIWPIIRQNFAAGFIEDYVLWFGELLWIPTLFIPITLVLQFFPDGQLPSRRWKPLLFVTSFAIIGFFFTYSVQTWPHLEVGIDGTGNLSSSGFDLLLSILETVTLVAFFIGIIGSLLAVTVRFRRSRGIERIQMKWLVYTAVVGISALIISNYLPRLLAASLLYDDALTSGNPVSDVIFGSLPAFLALSIGIAILRHRLFDIDIIIRRTVQYAILTALLALIYFALVVTLQNLFTAVGGQESPIFIVISTLVIAALFTPLRNRIQDIIDRRFYRKKYEAEKALGQFSRAARDEVDLDELSTALLDVVQETIQPKHLSLWLTLPKQENSQ